jgi:hypothetical protein
VPGSHFWHLVSSLLVHSDFAYSPCEQELQPEHCVSIDALQPYLTKLVLLHIEQVLHISLEGIPCPVWYVPAAQIVQLASTIIP